jgi:tagaturonate reductase
MILSRYNLKNIHPGKVGIPEDFVMDLPERVLQFGTGVLLRGLPDHYIDKANKAGIFNGKIVVVKSTSAGDTTAFQKQDGLYTICFRGLKNGKQIEENIVNASISRVLSATDEWEQILECAHNQNMQVVISNTTEVGIQLINDDIRHHPPKSFPGKLLAFLYERFKAFQGSEHSGMVIIPTELIPDNGKKLESIVLELAHLNGLEDEFIEWIENHNRFCNSLVDRIVPGRPEQEELALLEKELGYQDSLLTVAEPYGLWAIEGGQDVKDILSFAKADAGVIIQPDINIYRELKLRLLNGTHTLSCGVAYLAGCETVKQSMDVPVLANFISDLMQKEIAHAIPFQVEIAEAIAFGEEVLDRFRNSRIKHQWLSITMNYSSKMKMRCIPILLEHYKKNETPPEAFALGFAAYLAFMRAQTKRGNQYYGDLNGVSYLIQDEQAELFYKRWAGLTVTSLVQDVLRDNAFWGADLHALPGFHHSVVEKLNMILAGGVKETIESMSDNKSFAA